MIKATFISDAGHGWLSVSRKDIAKLDIQDKISPFSYMTNTRAYLEEDCDASLFVDEVKKQGIEIEIKKSKSIQDYSFIRNLSQFNIEWFNQKIENGLKVKLLTIQDDDEYTVNIAGKKVFLRKNGIDIYKTSLNMIIKACKPSTSCL